MNRGVVFSFQFSVFSSRRWLAVVGGFLLTFFAPAADFAEQFAKGNAGLAQGRAAEALAAYEQIPAAQTSAALEFNRGLAHAQLGQLGRALGHLRTARRLAPRDADIRASIAQVRARVVGARAESPPGETPLDRLTLNEWAMLAGLAVWTWFGLLFAAQARAFLRQTLRGYTAATGLVALLLTGLLAAAWWTRRMEPQAIVTSANAAVRISPLDEAKVAFTAADGAEFRLREQRDDWLLVAEPGSGRAGWIRRSATALVPLR